MGWVNRQTAAASQIPAQDGNSAPTHAQLTEVQRSRGFPKLLWNSKNQLYASRVLRQTLSALLVDRPGANLYSHLPLVARSSVLLK